MTPVKAIADICQPWQQYPWWREKGKLFVIQIIGVGNPSFSTMMLYVNGQLSIFAV